MEHRPAWQHCLPLPWLHRQTRRAPSDPLTTRLAGHPPTRCPRHGCTANDHRATKNLGATLPSLATHCQSGSTGIRRGGLCSAGHLTASTVLLGFGKSDRSGVLRRDRGRAERESTHRVSIHQGISFRRRNWWTRRLVRDVTCGL
jgi:hypothetical protein